MTGVILVGGAGTRLRPFTYVRPKPMMPLVNKPLLQYQVELLRRHGIDDVVLCAGTDVEAIRQYFGAGEQLGLNIHYSVEPTPLGTGGAVRYALPHVCCDTMIVLNGDGLIDYDLSSIVSFHRNAVAAVTIALAEVPMPTPSGVVVTDREGRVLSFDEPDQSAKIALAANQPGIVNTASVNAGVYVISRAAMESIEYGVECSIEKEFFPSLVKGGLVFGFPMSGYWMDMGTPRNYLTANRDLLLGKVDADLPGAITDGGYRAGDNIHVHPAAQVLSGANLGDGTEVRAGAHISGTSSIGPGCVIGENSEIDGCMLLENISVGRSCVLKNCIVDRDSKLQDNVQVADNSIIAVGTVLVAPNLAAHDA